MKLSSPCIIGFVALLLCPAVATIAAEPPVIGGLASDGSNRFAGAVLVSELGCTACHVSDQAAFAAKRGPDLATVGARVNGEHLKRFVANPSAVKPGTTMPDVLAHLPEEERAETAEAIAHYLATLGKMEPSALPAAEAVERGGKLYHSVGCVACHSPEPALAGSVPLGPVADKYTLASLTAFLQDPLAARPSGRMPVSHLEHFEAEDIASYLLREQAASPEVLSPDAGLAARGKTLFAQHHCGACHSTGAEVAPPHASPGLSKLRASEGCLSANQSGPSPKYPLSEKQRDLLREAIGEEGKAWAPAELIQLSLTRLNCIACHQRDELGGIAANRNAYFTGREESLGEQGRIPPTLSGVGAKLKTTWLHQVIASGAGVRTTMNTRMPRFGAAISEPLVAWLKQVDTLPPAQFERVPRAAKPHDIGRELAGTKGLNCIACHEFRGRPAAIRGPELTTITERLEENWFHHFLAQPQRFAPLTVMPAFWPDGKSPLPNVLGGDPGHQRDAIWQYLERGPEAAEPAGLILEPLVIEVQDEAVIVRRAFPGIGKRGIGVGYPGGINIAFDAAQMRLASLWSGGFIEASGLWRGQGSGQSRLLGKDTVNFPPGQAFAVLDSPNAPWPAIDVTPRKSPFAFLGYTLDAQQRPTFRYSVGGVAVEDFFIERRAPDGRLYLERTLNIPAPPGGMYFRVAAEKGIEQRDANTFAAGSNLLIRVTGTPFLREAAGTTELLLPASATMKLEYHLVPRP
ncbi:MAG: c-type cytochrome [Chthoniobacteraceae bacterium]